MLSEADGSEAIGTAGQQGDDHVHKGDPVGEVGPGRQQRTGRWVSRPGRPPVARPLTCGLAPDPAPSPVAVEVFQLFLDVAADAAAIVAVQPLPHHAQADLPLVSVKRKVLHLGCDATPPAKATPLLLGAARLGSLRRVPADARDKR